VQKLRIDAGFRSLLPALSKEEAALLEKNLCTDGCQEPLVVWVSEEYDEPTILDGHNRYDICTRLGIEFETVDVEDCPTREAAIDMDCGQSIGATEPNAESEGTARDRTKETVSHRSEEATGHKYRGIETPASGKIS
jgi:hypothetical protein